MGKVKRYCTALTRYRKSKGFGIHSPFAFRFVLRVLREKSSYYAYADIDAGRDEALRLKKKLGVRRPKMVSRKSARMIFRITNCFNPDKILQLGTNYGVTALSAILVSHDSCLWMSECAGGPEIALTLLSAYRERITVHSSCADAIAAYRRAMRGESPFVIVNRVDAFEYESVLNELCAMAVNDAVIVMRNLSRDKTMAALWRAMRGFIPYGMTFSNGKTAVAIVSERLPRQDFQLWF